MRLKPIIRHRRPSSRSFCKHFEAHRHKETRPRTSAGSHERQQQAVDVLLQAEDCSSSDQQQYSNLGFDEGIRKDSMSPSTGQTVRRTHIVVNLLGISANIRHRRVLICNSVSRGMNRGRSSESTPREHHSGLNSSCP